MCTYLYVGVLMYMHVYIAYVNKGKECKCYIVSYLKFVYSACKLLIWEIIRFSVSIGLRFYCLKVSTTILGKACMHVCKTQLNMCTGFVETLVLKILRTPLHIMYVC